MASNAATAAGDRIVFRWFDEFNARNLDGMLECLAGRVDFHPLRLNGCRAAYIGHDGVMEWWAQLHRGQPDHQIILTGVRHASDGRVLASGMLSLAGEAAIGPFCALHSLENGLIVSAHHYLSDPDMIEHVGLLR